ncbi:DUF2243 domain-containing protein [Cohnella caldifontis]|uniref:DUF2243 domain-containing protein n=1 Tax=Cohnella caldifontis TaxID=3027471 RepID=UPI0023EAD8FD|nr:DUF2243 domain-containing protein [Cohnella sp. YIM B05605]
MWRNKSFLGALFTGMGVVGMLDGIVFHQILQWHSVIMETDRTGQIQSDGWFHLFVTALSFTGALLLRDGAAGDRPRLFWGGILMGAGIFNLVEGIVDHHLLQIHYVRLVTDHFAYDVSYDLFAALLILAGWTICRRARAYTD